MAENTDWFEGMTIEDGRRGYDAGSVDVESRQRMHFGSFIVRGNLLRIMPVLLVLALLSAAVLSWW